MITVALPPTSLAADLVSTLLVCTIASSTDPDLKLAVKRGNQGELLAEINVKPSLFVSEMIQGALDKIRIAVRRAYGKLPLIPGTTPGTDGKTVSDILRELNISRISLKEKNRLQLFSYLVEVIKRRGTKVVNELSKLTIDVDPHERVYRLYLGGQEYPVPVLVKSEAFYEIGRFGGTSDRRKKGRPDMGRVEYRASLSYSALLYALLLALQAGYEKRTEEYMFTTVQLGPGEISFHQATNVYRIYDKLAERVQNVSLHVWSQDYEGLRLAVTCWLVSEYQSIAKLRGELVYPENLTLILTIVRATGRRFYTVWSTGISFSEIDSSLSAVEHVANEIGLDAARLARYVALLITSALKLQASQTQHSATELWQGVKMLAYMILSGSRHGTLDVLYKLLRLLSESRIGLRSAIIGTIKSTADTLREDLSKILLGEYDHKATIWKILRKLVDILIA